MRTSTILPGVAVFVGLLLLASDRTSGEERERAGRMPDWDQNGDGRVTSGEVPEDKRAFFRRALRFADEDGDGALNSTELARVQSQGRQAREKDARRAKKRGRRGDEPGGLFSLLDTDHDGKLTGEELAQAPKLLANNDADGDGALSVRELLRASRRRETMMDDPRRDVPEVRRVITRLDTDGDGAIARSEARGRLQKQFDRLDKNADGKLSQEELERFRQKRSRNKKSKKAKLID